MSISPERVTKSSLDAFVGYNGGKGRGDGAVLCMATVYFHHGKLRAIMTKRHDVKDLLILMRSRSLEKANTVIRQTDVRKLPDINVAAKAKRCVNEW